MKELKRQSFLNLIVLLLAVLLSQMTWAQQNIPFNAIIVPEDAFMFYLEQDVTGAPKKTESHSQNYYGGNKSYPQLYNAYQLSPVTFSSSNQGVATIDQTTGVITAVGIGSTTISAYFGGNDAFFEKSTSYTLTFTDDRDDMEISGVAFSSSTASATYGDKTANTPTISSGKLGNATFTYSSSNEGVAMVDNIGTVTIKGAGTAEIKASFAGNDNFKPGYLTYTLTVAQKEVGITWGTTKFTYDGSSHVPTATATGLIGFDVCTINVEGEKTDAGSYTATASSISNANYMLPADKSTSFTISKAVPSVTAAPSANSLTYTGSAQALVTAGTASCGTMQYSLDKQTYSEAIPTGTDAGSYTVYYRVVGDANHEDADGGQVSVTIDKAASSVAFASKTANAKMGESYASQTATTIPSGLPLTYSSSNTGVATVDASSGTVTLVSPGSTTITAIFAGNDNYNAAQDSYKLSVAKADAVDVELSFSSATATATYGDAAVNAPALNNPYQLPLVWTSSNKKVAKVNVSGKITIVGAGQAIISASFAGNEDYKAKAASFTLTVNKATASVTFASKTANAKIGESYASQTATTIPSGLPLTYSSSNTGVATVDASSGTVTLASPGSTTITAIFAGNDNYNAAQDSYKLSVAKADAVDVELSFSSATATATYGDAAVNAPALNNPYQLPLVWTSSNKKVAKVNVSGKITIVGAGQAIISASFAGNEEYKAKAASFTLTVNKATASVTFASKTANAKIGEGYASQTATTIPSGLPLTYSSSNTGVATVDASSGTVTLLSPGSTTITATFAGNDNYTAAQDSYELSVAKADAVEVELSFGSATATATYGDAAVNAPALNNPHQLPLVWTSSNENVAMVNAFGDITIVGAGQAIIYASFAGNDEYQAKTIYFTLTVNKYPVSVAFATSAETATLGEDFVSPKATVIPSGITLVYSSSDPNVASVDAYMGEVTLLGEGTVMITAAFNGSDNFESASAYYYLTIEKATPRLEPIVKEVEYPLDVDAYFINADGSEVDLSNTIVNNILFTLKNQNSPEGDGYDTEDHCIVINTVTSTSTVNALQANNVEPGSADYASQFTGLSFLVPAGEGYIIVTSQEADGVYLMVKVGEKAPVAIHLSEMGDYSIPYKSDFLTMVRMWKGDSDAQSYASTRGKKKMADVRVTKVTYKAVSSNGIQLVSVDAFDDNHWYDLNGQRISQPVKKGVYIHGNRKVVIK